MALKPLYWNEGQAPKDWYLFEDKIKLVEVPEQERNAVDLICSESLFEKGEWCPKIILDLRAYKHIDAIMSLMQNVPDNWYTIYSKFP